MAGRTRRRRKPAGQFREIGSYFSKPAPAMESAAPPPAKKPKKGRVDLSILLPPCASVAPSTLPTPSPSPVSLSPLTSPPAPSAHTASSPSPPLPKPPPSSSPLPPTPTSPLSPSLTQDLESLLLLRNIDPEVPSAPSLEVQLFTRSQMCVAESYLDQLEHMGLSPRRLDRLLDYLISAVGPSRLPPAGLLCRLWSLTSDIKVVQEVGPDRVLRVACLFHSLLSLHPPCSCLLAHQQFSHFLRRVGGACGESGAFAVWMHIRQLISSSWYKYFHHHLSFLVDLLLSDFWTHVHGQRSGSPLFVSVFWSSPRATDSMSLPVRQLMDSISHTLHSYTGSEAEFVVLQSRLALFFLVATHCSEATDHLLQLSLKLTSQQFILLAGSLHPTPLVAKLGQHRCLNSVAGREGRLWVSLSPNSKLPNIGQLQITNSASLAAPVEAPTNYIISLLKKLPYSPVTTTAPVAVLQTGPLLAQLGANTASFQPPVTNATSLLNKAKRVSVSLAQKLPAHTVTQMPATVAPLHSSQENGLPPGQSGRQVKRRNTCWQVPVAKRPRLRGRLCENCDAGTPSCHHCKCRV